MTFEKLESRAALSVSAPKVVDINVSSSAWDEAFVGYLESAGLGDGGYSVPVGSAAQSQPIPWSNIDRLSITFSEDVDVQAADLSVSGVAVDWYAHEQFFYDPQQRQGTWTFSTPFADEERLHIDLDADGIDPVKDLDGNVLDGEWLDEFSVYESGNGFAGGDFEFRFNMLLGDHYATGLVDYTDYYATYYAVGKGVDDVGYEPMYDSDGNGLIEQSDWQVVMNNLGATLPTGTPTGSGSDAPTTLGFSLATISDRSLLTRVSLHEAFDDIEDSDTNLTYSIVSTSNAGLFDSVSIDASAGEILLDPADVGSGRSKITVSATDSSGLSVETILPADVGYTNTPPTIHDFVAIPLGYGTWEVSGSVEDDDVVEGMIVELTGLFEARVVVRADGTFAFDYDAGSLSGDVFAETSDRQSERSAMYSTFLGV